MFFCKVNKFLELTYICKKSYLGMAEYSSILLEKAVDELSKLPGVGKKTALRLDKVK